MPQHTHLFRQLSGWVVAALLGLSISAQAAPPGWELRNGAWVPVVQPDPGTPEGQVAAMIHDLEANNTKKVIKDAKKWLKTNKTNPLVPQVLILHGDAEVMRKNRYAALFPYEDLITNFPTSELYPSVLQREYDIADSFLKGYKRKFLGMRILPVGEDAVEILDRIQDRQRGSPLAERAGLRVADYYYSRSRFQESVEAYTDFLRRYPYSQYVRKAEIRRAEACLGYFRGVLFDLTPLLDARERLAAISQVYPQSAEQLQVHAIEDRIYQIEGRRELEIARYYWRAGRRYASGWYYQRVINNWPGTIYAQEAATELRRKMPEKVAKK